jgi:t-SNARE complex subunit (syntaxin)
MASVQIRVSPESAAELREISKRMQEATSIEPTMSEVVALVLKERRERLAAPAGTP